MSVTDHNLPSYGIWHVTTEGDSENKTTKDLGVYQGHLDEIALALASQASYGLRFERANTLLHKMYAPETEVHVSLNIETKTWDMSKTGRISYFADLLAGRNVSVVESCYYASVKLISGATPDAQEAARRSALMASARAKLSADERKLLGLE